MLVNICVKYVLSPENEYLLMTGQRVLIHSYPPPNPVHEMNSLALRCESMFYEKLEIFSEIVSR
jgi:hypothetical protein